LVTPARPHLSARERRGASDRRSVQEFTRIDYRPGDGTSLLGMACFALGELASPPAAIEQQPEQALGPSRRYQLVK
jgi:hypothetical protein